MRQQTIAAVQRHIIEVPDLNREQCAAAIAEAAAAGANLVVLSELHNSPYFCQIENPDFFDLAEPIPGPSTVYFGNVARCCGVVVVISLFERRAPGLCHNTAVVLEKDGSIAGCYRKMHIPDDPGYYEKFYFTPGDTGFRPIRTSVGSLGLLICWDQWFPEAARLMALAGADLLIYPTAIGYDPHEPEEEQRRQLEAWITIQRAHAIANNLPVISVNRVGFENHPVEANYGIEFWGNSFIAGPQGEFLARAGAHEESTLLATLDLDRTESTRRMWPFLRDRRIDAYEDLLKRFRS